MSQAVASTSGVQCSGSQSSNTNVSFDLVQCDKCSRRFKGVRGLKIHVSRAHKSITQSSTQPPNSPPVGDAVWERLGILKQVCPIIKRIPRGARITVATSLSRAIRKVVSDNSYNSWEQLLTFAFQVLYIKKTNKKSSLTNKIKQNCANLSLQPPPINSHVKKAPNPNAILQKVEEKAGNGDLRGAAQLLFSSDVIASDCLDTRLALEDKHPVPSPSLRLPNAPDPSDQHVVTSRDEVFAAVMSFKSGSAGGLDGLSPQHIKDLISGATGDVGRSLLEDITQLANIMLEGAVCPDILDVLYGANLCALKKKDGGIRPIAVGCTWRRIVSKICCRHILPTVTDYFCPVQLGFGSRGGCEAAVHATRTFLDQNGGEVLLKVDVKNAFNSVDRGALLTQIKQITPHVYNYLWQCYSSPSKLLFRNHPINSAVGCQQGDPLGPAIFSLAIHPIISSLFSKLNLWYLDDGTLGGDVNSVLEDLRSLIAKFSTIGLDLNFSKCELYVSNLKSEVEKTNIISKFNSLAPNIKIQNKDTLSLLGAPIFSESIPPLIDSISLKFNSIVERLLNIHPHIAFTIIRFCLFAPRAIYLLRCSPLWKHPNLLLSLDESIQCTLSSVLNCHFDSKSWTQASLPIRFGGLGIRSIKNLSLPAFLSSVHSTLSLTTKIILPSLGGVEVSCLSEARNAWSAICPNCDLPTLPNSQRHWDEPLCKMTFSTLLESAVNDTERARLLAVSEREAGFWLHAIPSPNTGTLLSGSTLTLSVCLRLGIKTNEPHRCLCGTVVDIFGHHGLSCLRSAGRLSRHANLNDVIRRALSTVNVPAVLEPNGLARDDGKRPDGMTLVAWSQGRSLVWDATCVDTLAPSHIRATSVSAGAAASAAEDLKRRKYSSLSLGHIFAPFGVETLGPWGPAARKLFREISVRLIETTGDPRAGAYFGQRLSLVIQRGNAASVLGTLPLGSDLESLFYL